MGGASSDSCGRVGVGRSLACPLEGAVNGKEERDWIFFSMPKDQPGTWYLLTPQTMKAGQSSSCSPVTFPRMLCSGMLTPLPH